jgi:hypothetical protein
MNETLETMWKRRSIRKYRPERIRVFLGGISAEICALSALISVQKRFVSQPGLGSVKHLGGCANLAGIAVADFFKR